MVGLSRYLTPIYTDDTDQKQAKAVTSKDVCLLCDLCDPRSVAESIQWEMDDSGI